MSKIFIDNGILYLSASHLRNEHNISDKTIQCWKGIKRYIDSLTFVSYEDIPAPTRSKLPSKNDLIGLANEGAYNEKVEQFLRLFKYEYNQGYIKYIPHFKEQYRLPLEKINKAAKRYAVWLVIIDLTLNHGVKDNQHMYTAYNEIFTGQYKNLQNFANAKSAALKEGAEYMAIDRRWFQAPTNVKKVTPLHQYWVTGLVSIGKKYSNRTVWEMLCEMCDEAKEKKPSLSWVDKYRKAILKGNIGVFAGRYGNDEAFKNKQPHASMQAALHANDQWQMDGWQLPFWGDKFQRYVIVIVRDAYSKKIVGYAVGKTENTLLIMGALNDAITNTGCLPHEIVTDNHAFNQTGEAKYFKEETACIGMTFTVTSNPQWKSIIERYNKNLDAICRGYFGYTGEGVKSKNVDAHPTPELIAKYAKSFLTADEIKLNALHIVDTWNNRLMASAGKSPNHLFEDSDKLNCFALTMGDRIKVLTPKTDSKILRGQVTIKRGYTKHEYALPASLFSQYNDETVIVRYEDLHESIYLFDFKTDEFIAELKPKGKIHGAKANQTERDIELLNKNKGHITGVKIKAKKRGEELTRQALEQNPEAYALLNKKTTPKNILKEAEQNAHLRQQAAERGINLSTVYIPDRQSEMENTALIPVEKKIKSPFSTKIKVVTVFNPMDIDND
jgi:hypothetical protein